MKDRKLLQKPYSTQPSFVASFVREPDADEYTAEELAAQAAKKIEEDSKKTESELAAETAAKALAKANAEKAELLGEVMAKKEANKSLSESFESMKGDFASLKKSLGDLTADDIKAIVQSGKDAETASLESKGEYETIVAGMKDDQQKIIDQMNAQQKEASDALQAVIDEQATTIASMTTSVDEMTVGRSFGESVFLRESSVLPASVARTQFGSHFDYVDGKVVGFDLPKGKDGRVALVDAEGNNKSFEAAIESLYEKHPESKAIIRSKKKPGSGGGGDEISGKKFDSGKTKLHGRERIGAALAAQKS